MGEVVQNIGIVLLFIVIGGFFAGSEIALISLRDSQVRGMAARGGRGQRVANLAADPNRFLSAVQIGVTLAGFMSAAFGGAVLAPYLSPLLVAMGLPEGAAGTVALVVITLITSYVSLVIGELVPKRMALQRAEGISLIVAPVLDRIASLARPAIWLLSVSTNLVVRLLGGDPRADREEITEEEVRDIVAEHESLGADERGIISRVFITADRPLREVMVPRTEVNFIEAGTSIDEAARTALTSEFSRFPVYDGGYDRVIGFVHVRDLLQRSSESGDASVRGIVREVPFLPSTKQVLDSMTEMRGGGHHMAIVLDEYGGTAGIATLEDLVEELVGEIRDEYDRPEKGVRHLQDASIEVSGLLNLTEFAEQTGLRLPKGAYETAAGYVMTALGRVPSVGASVDTEEGHRLTVAEMDGRRVDRIRVTPPAEGDGRVPARPDAPAE
ncbi:putative hemolysin [Spinactinospora alkalitolerans]|uniref:Putative hemolysin n=1 Tax=Spinactinospora alkalitolerans TaxID=687207 RepID=A0A852TWN4_9ACTN|nr:hemolysin family protein [Spinactinospora alkalitolerans]NYE48926.1 putative hemolysin [Spinactinospora alkalitolerans]